MLVRIKTLGHKIRRAQARITYQQTPTLGGTPPPVLAQVESQTLWHRVLTEPRTQLTMAATLSTVQVLVGT